ncbi:cobalt ECF transporter T component CbiQ [Desulfotomaculum copahuensis]|uniref:Cobalt ECF transporter T component CbiQ n=1 Tax=Desulfotomaculum copahuensis TaxID=1838280 RepID=A0A1B7LGH1_9FIRM|nr:cobalt ECF transporter T component CbiQ [Desulfotomaculum copahuensis]OAT85201.1 cobalt ECF transporter T component CbiQ [Desulfotomaculum copahuensis]
MELATVSESDRKESFFQCLDGRVKTCLLLAAVFIAVMLRHWYLVAGIWLATLLLFAGLGLPWSKLLRRLTIPFGVAWLVLLNLLFTQGHTVIGQVNLHFWTLPVYWEGLAMGFLIMLRIMAAVSLAALLSFTTPMPEILATLRILKIPGLMIDLAEMIYRYILLLEETAVTMRHAQLSRGGEGMPWYRQARDVGTIAGNVLVKALDRSVRIYKAMLSRGYDENAILPPYFTGKIPFRDLACGAAGGLVLLAVLAGDFLFH